MSPAQRRRALRPPQKHHLPSTIVARAAFAPRALRLSLLEELLGRTRAGSRKKLLAWLLERAALSVPVLPSRVLSAAQSSSETLPEPFHFVYSRRGWEARASPLGERGAAFALFCSSTAGEHTVLHCCPGADRGGRAARRPMVLPATRGVQRRLPLW